jgi:hypothetical protein
MQDEGTVLGLSYGQARDLEQRYPGWRAWKSARGGQWHARLADSQPPVLVHDDDPAGLAEQIKALSPLSARLDVPGD